MNKNVLLVALIAFSCSVLFGSFFIKDHEQISHKDWINKQENIVKQDSREFKSQFDDQYFDPNEYLINAFSEVPSNTLSTDKIKSIYANCFDELLVASEKNIENSELINHYLNFYKKELSSISQILPQSDWIALTRINNHLNGSIVSFNENNNEELLRSLARLRNSFEHQIESGHAELVKYP